MLWLQCGGPPTNAAAATASLFSKNLYKTNAKFILFGRNLGKPYFSYVKLTFLAPKGSPTKMLSDAPRKPCESQAGSPTKNVK